MPAAAARAHSVGEEFDPVTERAAVTALLVHRQRRPVPLSSHLLGTNTSATTRSTMTTGAPGPRGMMQMQLQRRPSGLPDWLYAAIVAALGVYFIIGGIAWTVFIYNGVVVPESFTTILATIAGGLVGVLAPTRGDARAPQSSEERTTRER